jgi:hypothetical protein
MSGERQPGATKVAFRGKTKAYKRFLEVSWRTRELLDAGLAGFDEQATMATSILQKLDTIPRVSGSAPQDRQSGGTARKFPDGSFLLELDVYEARALRRAIRTIAKARRGLRFHLYSVLLVYIWAAFETYLTMLLEELYHLQPGLLRSKEQVTYEEILENSHRVVDHLIEQQLERLGRGGLSDVLKYLVTRTGLALTERQKTRLASFYLLRNIIAHNTGLVLSAQKEMLPAGTRAVGQELLISRRFLREMLRDTTAAVASLERQAIRKFIKDKESLVSGLFAVYRPQGQH